jgi:DNA-binding response OmpR family regulator
VPKLLLADDSPTTQKVVQLTFADEGIDVIVADDGDLAMELYDHHHPDIVLADINIPGLNGYEVCETIRKRAWNGTTPVILLAGSFEPFDVEEAHRVGANDYLTKPFSSIRRLVATVTAMLDTVTRHDTAVEETIEPNSSRVDTNEPDMTATNDIEQLYHESVSSDEAVEPTSDETDSLSETDSSAVEEEPNAEPQVAESSTFADDLAYDDELIETTYKNVRSNDSPVVPQASANSVNSLEHISLESIPMPAVEPEPAEIPQSQIPTVSFGSEQINSQNGELQPVEQGEMSIAESERSEPISAETPSEQFQIDQSGDEAFFEPEPETAPIAVENMQAGSAETVVSANAETAGHLGELISDQFQPESFAVPEIDRPEELGSSDATANGTGEDEAGIRELAADNTDNALPHGTATPWDSVAGPAAPRSYELDAANLLELPIENSQEDQHADGNHTAVETVRSLTPELVDRIAKLTAEQISEELIREIAQRVVPRVIDEVLDEIERRK